MKKKLLLLIPCVIGLNVHAASVNVTSSANAISSELKFSIISNKYVFNPCVLINGLLEYVISLLSSFLISVNISFTANTSPFLVIIFCVAALYFEIYKSNKYTDILHFSL